MLSSARCSTAEVYPRVCGGTPLFSQTIWNECGLSPRVRGNRCHAAHGIVHQGSIPACAGEPDDSVHYRSPPTVYPRVCGGTAESPYGDTLDQGLSPRVRGNPALSAQASALLRSIPACAGEPTLCWCAPTAGRVYPRVCGGTLYTSPPELLPMGLSPRVRGNPPRACHASPPDGSIPACAGEPSEIHPCTDPAGVYPRVCGGTRSCEEAS